MEERQLTCMSHFLVGVIGSHVTRCLTKKAGDQVPANFHHVMTNRNTTGGEEGTRYLAIPAMDAENGFAFGRVVNRGRKRVAGTIVFLAGDNCSTVLKRASRGRRGW